MFSIYRIVLGPTTVHTKSISLTSVLTPLSHSRIHADDGRYLRPTDRAEERLIVLRLLTLEQYLAAARAHAHMPTGHKGVRARLLGANDAFAHLHHLLLSQVVGRSIGRRSNSLIRASLCANGRTSQRSIGRGLQ